MECHRKHFLNGRTSSTTSFYLPDMRQCYVKGSGLNTSYSMKLTVPSATLGTFQEMSVQSHKHFYYDRGADSKTVATGGVSTTTIANNITELWNTQDTVYYSDDSIMSSGETRPNTVVLNYSIKFSN